MLTPEGLIYKYRDQTNTHGVFNSHSFLLEFIVLIKRVSVRVNAVM